MLSFPVKLTHSSPQPESPASSTHSDLGDEHMSSNASPSAEVKNLWAVCDAVDTHGDMDNKPGPQSDPIDLQSDERQSGGFESMTEAGRESRWGSHLFVAFVSFSFGIAVAYTVIY